MTSRRKFLLGTFVTAKRLLFAVAGLALVARQAEAAFVIFQASSSAASDPWAASDGRANASGGSAQYPTLLNGFPLASPPGTRVLWPTAGGTQPAWHVAGVDYAVGITSGTVLKDPYPGGSLASALVALGGVYDDTNFPEITFTNTSLTLDGWDFSLHGGFAIVIRGCTNVLIQNCKFNSINYTGMINIYSDSSGGTVQYNEFTGGAGPTFNGNCCLTYTGNSAGAVLFQYNWCHDMATDCVAMNSSATNFTVRWNTVYNLAVYPSSPPAGLPNAYTHFNAYGYSSASASTTTNAIIAFNTYVQFPIGGDGNYGDQAGGEFIQIYNNLNSGGTYQGGNIAGCTINNNTFVAVGTANPLAAVRQNSTAYVLGDMITVPGGNCLNYGCNGAGTSAGSQPGAYASTGVGTYITDGTATFSGGNNVAVSVVFHGPYHDFPTKITGTAEIFENYIGGIANIESQVYYGSSWLLSDTAPSGSVSWTVSGNISMDDGTALNTVT